MQPSFISASPKQYQSMRNNIAIEKPLRLKRQKHSATFQARVDHQSQPLRASDPEFAAKDMLFELSSNENIPQEEKALSINQWLHAPYASVPTTPITSAKRLTSQHKSVYITCNDQQKMSRRASQESRSLFSVIPHLKSHLRKLQSPEKTRAASAKHKEGKEAKPIKSDQNFQFNLIRTDTLTPKYARRTKNPSLYKRQKKSSFIHNFTEGREWHLPFGEKPSFQQGRMGHRVQLMKEARRNRTLMNLLF